LTVLIGVVEIHDDRNASRILFAQLEDRARRTLEAHFFELDAPKAQAHMRVQLLEASCQSDFPEGSATSSDGSARSEKLRPVDALTRRPAARSSSITVNGSQAMPRPSMAIVLSTDARCAVTTTCVSREAR
jgi:hypothetical protein